MVPSRDAVAGAESQRDDFELYRRELTGFCYRMLGSGFEADDAVQETMLRAWRSAGQFEGRSSVRSWLYKIATNICLDMLRGRKRRALPMELGPSSAPLESNLGPMLPEHSWVSPIADSRVLPEGGDPAEIVAARDSIRLAFVTALQHLPGRQRAALILCEVLRWQATEVADLLETSVAAVNSALQRARTTLAAVRAGERPKAADTDNPGLLERYVDAFQRYDIAELVTLLHEDAIMAMPPYAMWIRGAENIGHFMLEPLPSACRGSVLLPAMANGCPAFGQYKPGPGGWREPWALQVHEVDGALVSRSVFFLDAAPLFEAFGLPARLPA